MHQFLLAKNKQIKQKKKSKCKKKVGKKVISEKKTDFFFNNFKFYTQKLLDLVGFYWQYVFFKDGGKKSKHYFETTYQCQCQTLILN